MAALANDLCDERLVDAAVALAAALQQRATELQTAAERRQQAELARMLASPDDKATLVELTDQAFRSRSAARTAEQFAHILDVQGIPRFFDPLDRTLLRGFQTFGDWLPSVTVPLVKSHLRHETANVVLPAEPDVLHEHLDARRRQGVRMNLNLLGESLLGEKEAEARLASSLAALQSPDVEVLSVKISTLLSQIWPIAREQTLRQLCDRLELLYREAAHLSYVRPDGTTVPKFVYLDMEEYRDLWLTAEAFMRTLSRPGLERSAGGIALQAYVPDSFLLQQRITAWARDRVAKGGGAVTIRIVKGANMEMERIDAALHDWPQAPYLTKAETDASYKDMLRYGLRPEHLEAVRIGVASHNLFDVAYGLVLAAEAAAGDRVQFEMLEGMANHQRRALLERSPHLLLYAPACRKESFLNAIGYLIRRLDENTGPENFLGHAFRLAVGSPDWQMLERGFRDSSARRVTHEPRRSQDRRLESFAAPRPEMPWHDFGNEPDTDWSLPANGAWAEVLVAGAAGCFADVVVPAVVAGEERRDLPLVPGLDPSHPHAGGGRHAQAGLADVEAAVACGKADPDGWRSRSIDERNAVLGHVALELRRRRGRLMQAALVAGGKTLAESDPEVSEAIDFVEFYRSSARWWHDRPGLESQGCGTVVVVSPWNFPIAIPCGGVAAALAAGNTVILKPASATVLVAWELCQAFWEAGVPRRALQLLPCSGSGPGAALVGHADVAAVILTGGTETALAMKAAAPAMRLSGETGGKNASVITALSDRELAIKHVVQSAFGHAGQKCSATSLLLLESEVYDDPAFERMLCDAVSSLAVGPADDLATRVGPLIRPPAGVLERGLKTLESGERWAVLPRQVGDNPCLWSPGVKYGVQPGSFTHRTEFFGPLLGVMRFERLSEAIEIVNATGYGLTSAIHSLDDRERATWLAGIRAGNLYVNRGTTGAIVLRQPFGGLGLSSVGPGMKAGGPNYVPCFMDFCAREDVADAPITPPQDASLAGLVAGLSTSTADDRLIRRAITDCDRVWREEFAREHDHFRLLGQDNLRRYLPFREVIVRVTAADTRSEVFIRVAAARVTGARVIVSHAPGCSDELLDELDAATESWGAQIEFLEESAEELVSHLDAGEDLRIRYAARSRVESAVREAANARGIWLADVPVVGAARLELLWVVREQSVSFDYHRYGNLGRRASEPRGAERPR